MKSLFDEKYGMLNPEQKQAVDTIDGPVFVMAGPGTGKTQILTLRIANILKQTDVEPENILALTFTNAAAYNMRERLTSIIGAEAAHRVYISTFHSFAEDMIRRYSESFPEYLGSRLVSPIEKIEILEKILDSLETKYFSVFKRREGTLKSIEFALGKIKSEGLSPEEFEQRIEEQYTLDLDHPDMFYKRAYGEFKKGDLKPLAVRKLDQQKEKNLELAQVYRAYQETMLAERLYDFNDVIVSMVHGLGAEQTLFQTELQEQFHYMLVDEHQDTNDAQNAIIHGLINNPVWEGKPNIFVVGDSKQAIYRFAGASEESFKKLLTYLTDPVVIGLGHNYRSHQGVLDTSHSLITKSEHHQNEQQLKAFFEHEGGIEYRQWSDYKMEMLFVALDIKQRIENGENPNEIAVLYRNNKDASEIRRLLDVMGINYKDFSKKNLLEDPQMLKLFLLLRATYNVLDNEAVARSLYIDFLEFNVFDIQKILHSSRNARGEYNKSIYGIISDQKKLLDMGIEEAQANRFTEYAEKLAALKHQSENTDFVSFFSDFIRESGFLKAILAHANSSRELSKIEKLFDEIKKEGGSRNSFTFDDFMNYLSVMKHHGITMNVTHTLSDGVSLMTFHGSKGLEFDTVYIIKALAKRKMGREIKLPFGDFTDGETEDERRLFYVALTRTRKNCLISSAIFDQEGREKTRLQYIDELSGCEMIETESWEQEHKDQLELFFAESNEHIVSLLDQDYIRERFLSNKLSVSALNNYFESPLKYFFRNLIFLPEARSPFLDFGNLMHETMERFFDACKADQEIKDQAFLQTCLDTSIERNHLYEEYRSKASDMLTAYYQNYKDTFSVPVENEFRIPAIPFELDNGETIHLTGVVDKITRDEEGRITVWDYKTGRSYSEMDKGRKEKLKRQAVFYKLLLQHAFSGKYNFHTAVFDFLEENQTKGEYERMSFEVSQSDVDELKREINECANDVLSGELLNKDFRSDITNKELLEFLEVLRGPRTYEQPTLL